MAGEGMTTCELGSFKLQIFGCLWAVVLLALVSPGCAGKSESPKVNDGLEPSAETGNNQPSPGSGADKPAGPAAAAEIGQALWFQEAYLKPPYAEVGNGFGGILSLYGDTLAVGAAGDDSPFNTIVSGNDPLPDRQGSAVPDSGAVHIFRRTGVIWAREAYIKPYNVNDQQLFGAALSLHEDTLAVGAPGESAWQSTIINGTSASWDESAPKSGAVYIYGRTVTGKEGTSVWSQQAYIKASNAEAGDRFGAFGAVSLWGDTLAVGALEEDSSQTTVSNGTGSSQDNLLDGSGAVYVYRRVGGIWRQEAFIKAANADFSDMFGCAISLSNDTLAVGAIWEASAQRTVTNAAVASSDNSAQFSGAVYVYRRSGADWAQEAYIKSFLSPSKDVLSPKDDLFGGSVALAGDTLAVGVYRDDSAETAISGPDPFVADDNAKDAGAVMIYRRQGTLWSPEAYIKASNADA